MRVYLLVFSGYVTFANAINIGLSHQHDVPIILSLLVLIGSFSTAGLLAELMARQHGRPPTQKHRSRRASRCRRQYHLARIPGRN